MPTRSKKIESKKKTEKTRFLSEKEKKQAIANTLKMPNFVPTIKELTDKALRRMWVALEVEIDPAKIGNALQKLAGFEMYLSERDKINDPVLDKASIKKINPQILKVLQANGMVVEDYDGEAFVNIENKEIKQIQQRNEIHNE